MKIQKKSTYSKKLIVATLLVLLLAGGYVAYAVYSNSKPNESITNNESGNSSKPNTPTTTDEQRDETPPAPAVTTNNSSKPHSDNTPETPSSPEIANDISVSLSSIQQHDSTLRIRTLINEITDEGTCKLSLEKDGKKVTRSATIQAMPSSSTCKGFDIDVTTLATGKWNITVDVIAGSSKGIAKGTVTLK